jgi:hypothetical protein
MRPLGLDIGTDLEAGTVIGWRDVARRRVRIKGGALERL